MVYIFSCLVFVALLFLVLFPEQKATVVEKEANNFPGYNFRDHYVSTVEAWQDPSLMDDLRFGDRETYTVSFRSNLDLPSIEEVLDAPKHEVRSQKELQDLYVRFGLQDVVQRFADQNLIDDEDEIDWGNIIIPIESRVKLSRSTYYRLEKKAQYGGLKTKWSTIHGREFGRRRKFKMNRAKARHDKWSQRLSWSSYNDLYEDELPYQIEKVVLRNKRDSFLAIK